MNVSNPTLIVKTIVEKHLSVKNVNTKEDIRHLKGMDDLNMLVIVSDVENKFNIKISNKKLENLMINNVVNVELLADVVREHITKQIIFDN